jgi:hypothetical protein
MDLKQLCAIEKVIFTCKLIKMTEDVEFLFDNQLIAAVEHLESKILATEQNQKKSI